MADLRGAYARHSVCPYQIAFILEGPWRRLSLLPERLAARLDLAPDDRVLEVGPGPGYFSVAVAKKIPDGHLELLDLQPEMLDKARRKLDRAGVGNVSYVNGDATELAYDNAFDVAFLVTVLGEVPDQDACLRGLRRALRPGGRLSITEQLPDPDFSRFRTVRSRVEGAGFVFERRFGRPWNYTANFRKSDG